MTTVGPELTNYIDPSLTWKPVSKGRNTSRRSRRSVSKNLKMVQEQGKKCTEQVNGAQASESEKTHRRRYGGNMEHIPIKKRRFLLRSPSPPPQSSNCLEEYDGPASGCSSDQHGCSDVIAESQVMAIDSSSGTKSNKSVSDGKLDNIIVTPPNVVQCSGQDFSGIAILAAAACSRLDNSADNSGRSQIGEIRKGDQKESFAPAGSDEEASLRKDCSPAKQEEILVDLQNDGTKAISLNKYANDAKTSQASVFSKEENNESISSATIRIGNSEYFGSAVSLAKDNVHVKVGSFADLPNDANKVAEKSAENSGASRDYRFHWDLNTVMDEWDEPLDHEVVDSTTPLREVGPQNAMDCHNSDKMVGSVAPEKSGTIGIGDAITAQPVVCTDIERVIFPDSADFTSGPPACSRTEHSLEVPSGLVTSILKGECSASSASGLAEEASKAVSDLAVPDKLVDADVDIDRALTLGLNGSKLLGSEDILSTAASRGSNIAVEKNCPSTSQIAQPEKREIDFLRLPLAGNASWETKDADCKLIKGSHRMNALDVSSHKVACESTVSNIFSRRFEVAALDTSRSKELPCEIDVNGVNCKNPESTEHTSLTNGAENNIGKVNVRPAESCSSGSVVGVVDTAAMPCSSKVEDVVRRSASVCDEQAVDALTAKEIEDRPVVATETEGKPVVATETIAKPVVATGTEGKPVVVTETEGKPVVATKTEGKAVVAKETEDQPVVANKTEGQPVVAKETEGQPLVAKEAEDQPMVAKENENKPVVAASSECDLLTDVGSEALVPEMMDKYGTVVAFSKPIYSPINQLGAVPPENFSCGGHDSHNEESSQVTENTGNGAELEGGYDSHLEDGELRESVGHCWEENEGEDGETEHVDYDSDNREGAIFLEDANDSVQLSGEVLASEFEKQTCRSDNLSSADDQQNPDKSLEENCSTQFQGCLPTANAMDAECTKREFSALKACSVTQLRGAKNSDRVEIDQKGCRSPSVEADIVGKKLGNDGLCNLRDASPSGRELLPSDRRSVDSIRRSRSSNFNCTRPADGSDESLVRGRPSLQMNRFNERSWNVESKSVIANSALDDSGERMVRASDDTSPRVRRPRIISTSRSGYHFVRRGSPGGRDNDYGMGMMKFRDTSPDNNVRGRFDRFSNGINRGFREGYRRPNMYETSKFSGSMLNHCGKRERSFSPVGGRVDPHFSRNHRKSRSRSRTRSPDFRSEARMGGRARLPYQPASSNAAEHMRDRRSPMRVFNQNQRFDSIGSPGRLRSDDCPRPMMRPVRFHETATTSGRVHNYEESDDYRRKPFLQRNNRRSRSRSRSCSPDFRPDARMGTIRLPYQPPAEHIRDRRSPVRVFRPGQRYDTGGSPGRLRSDDCLRPMNMRPVRFPDTHTAQPGRGHEYNNNNGDEYRRKPRNIFERIHPIRHYNNVDGNVRRLQYDEEDVIANPNFRRNENYMRAGERRPVEMLRSNREERGNNNMRFNNSDRVFYSGPKPFGGMRDYSEDAPLPRRVRP